MAMIVLILGLIYIILFYAALPLGALALAVGGFQYLKAVRDPEGKTPRALSAEEIEKGVKAQSPYDDAIGLLTIGAILAVVGGSITAHSLLGS